MPQQVYNIENSVTGELVLDGEGKVLEYTSQVDAANMAVYYTTTTGQTHTFVGPNPPIR